MRVAILACCVLALALLVLVGLSYTPGTSLEISRIELDNGVIIENVGNIPCLVFVISPEGVQQFQLGVAEKVTVIDIAKPISVGATSDLTTSWEDWQRMNRIHEAMVKTKYDLSSNPTDP
jgi:hypothetical protein